MSNVKNEDATMSYLIPELPRQIPTLGYAMHNIAMSLGAMAASTASFFFTLCVILPLSFVRMFMPANMLMQLGPNHQMNKNKVILVIGAAKGIGSRVVKQYADEPDTVIIAACKQMDTAKQVIDELGNPYATVHPAEIDLGGSKKTLSDAIRNLDSQYGPITHLYEVTGTSAHLKDSSAGSGLDAMNEMISAHVNGTFTAVSTMYELMKARRYGKICVVGSIPGLHSPNGMISYFSTKAFINTFCTSLRVLAAPSGVEVITVQPGFLDVTKQLRGRGIMMSAARFDSAELIARRMKRAVETGGVGVVSWPLGQGVMMHSLKAVNPICEDIARWATMQMGMRKVGMKRID